MQLIEMIEALKTIGVIFDQKNLQESIRKHNIQCRFLEVIDLATKNNLDLSKDIVKFSIITVVINYEELHSKLEAAMLKLLTTNEPLIISAIKKTSEFNQLLDILGESKVRRVR
ncbi:conserved hypothetical protein [Vibrio aestuarianus]|uniref:Uncharacterized protein n=1 Tax=Vibrio aestuarianus TaxID=28171 RepID=A0ABM9FKG9_9VIBR|nr:hypothetical protein [Vibrio aestuarianus]MDE1218596.1 hypothetical protein [Vibrio aestuarianus]MDE1259094.1 hypothetical protein [Vibrio aestuarianus]MDE1276994.1 hypothetical protein [Vibrio aestuarianus]MDE1284085.1 hypothetical protein [Vibrio aestuarianus]MDE1287216.1 hypothetical protein [Vibrio aestuarianus]